ncbi:hypothetical protein JAAARDRAFT_41777 [Jaapia argillacea MUCL 33604]|uniref:Uncharacterized protein n=1 Tax=Jaapia argillacea MUCL 33604 TaxID=933084 RepID=A0A067PA39_9AGAM|nr:hypothetical protein JAAARDRAFT_41777 [Jaapia argillacea MUCL 33604]
MTFEDGGETSLPLPNLGLINLPPQSRRVTDADEEIFLLYTRLSGRTSSASDKAAFRGLGHVDSHKDTLSIKFELTPPGIPSDQTTPPLDPNDITPPIKHKHVHHMKKTHKKKSPHTDPVTVEIELAQDKTALRSRKGDTGSVLWKASLEFAQFILQQHHFPPVHQPPLLESSRLAKSQILELGAGTGLLSIAFAPLVQSYTVTDIAELVPLIRKNVAMNFPTSATSSILDYHSHHAQERQRSGHSRLRDARGDHPPSHGHSSPSHSRPHSNHSTPSHSRPHSPPPQSHPNSSNIVVEDLDWITFPSSRKHNVNAGVKGDGEIDLILAVDCIYHPSLIAPLVNTIHALSNSTPPLPTPHVVQVKEPEGVDPLGSSGEADRKRTPLVLVLAELRAEDVIREFLDTWLNVSSSQNPAEGGEWEIWSVGEALGMDEWYGVWVGWRR